MAGIGTWRIVDPTDTTRVLFDCNDFAAAAANPGGLETLTREFQLRVPERELSRWSSRSAPGGRTIHARDPLTQTAWKQAITAPASVPNLRLGLNELNRLLRLGGVFELMFQGDTQTLFLDYEAGSGGAALGEAAEDPFRFLSSGQYPEGIPIVIERQPGLRGPRLTGSGNSLKNPLMVYDQAGTANRPDDWDWASATNISAESIARESYQFTCATASARDFQQDTATGTAAVGDVWSAAFEAETDAASGARVRCVIRFLDSAGAVLGAEALSTQVTLTGRRKRITVTSAAAPASTSKVRIICRVENADATARVLRFTKGYLKEEASPGVYVDGAQAVDGDVTASKGRAFAVYIEGNAPAPVEFKLKANEASTKILSAILSQRSNLEIVGNRKLTDWLNTTKFIPLDATANGWTISLTNDTSDTGASAVTTYASNPTVMNKRVRITRTALLDSLRGEFDLWVRVKATAAAKHVLQGGFSPSLADPVAVFSDEVVFDTSVNGTPASFGFVMLNLGRVFLPEDPAVTLAGIAIELHSRRESGTGNLEWNKAFLVPAEEQYSRLTVPEGSTSVVLGKDLSTPVTNPGGGTAGTVDGTSMKLDSNTDNCGTPPNTGLAWPVGRHTATVFLQLGFTNDQYTVLIRNITDSTTVASISRTSGVNAHVETLSIDSVAGKSYQIQVDVDNTLEMHVTSIDHSFVPYLVQNEQMRTDPGRSSGRFAETLDANGAVLGRLNVEGVLPAWLNPGFHVFYIHAEDVPIPLYEENEDLNRDLLVEVSYAPRFTG